MSGTYTKIHIQLVFAVKFRAALIAKEWSSELHKFITAIIQERNHKLLQINSMPDHIHILLGLRPKDSIASLTQLVKSESTKWINNTGKTKSKFNWQEGYGAFSYSPKDVPAVIDYIANQESHHKKTSFLEEYKTFLEEFDIDFEDRFLFTEPM
jgi:REP element-mobilizing transposase RayT